MAKTPSYALKLMKIHQEQMVGIADILRVKRETRLENQADWVKEKSEEHWIGIAHGFNSALASLLHAANCYAGYCHLNTKIAYDEKGNQVLSKWAHPTDEGYADWCVSYYTK